MNLQTYIITLEVDEDYLEKEYQSTLESELGWINREGIEIKNISREKN